MLRRVHRTVELARYPDGKERNLTQKKWIRPKSFGLGLYRKFRLPKSLIFCRVKEEHFRQSMLHNKVCSWTINEMQGLSKQCPTIRRKQNPSPVLPSKHRSTNLIIQDVHSEIKHSGLKDTLTAIRERFWIPRDREAVRGILRKCVTCKKVEGVPYRPLPTPDLPMERVSLDPLFAHTGLDFLGPWYIRDEKSLSEKNSNKVYVCLFNCAFSKAIYLELTPSLSVDSFLVVFRRFVSRRELPVTQMSDNATTFKSASKDIWKITWSEEVLRYLTDYRITWNFIVERAPRWGGYWEGMVKGVKQSVKKTVGRTILDYDELLTAVVEIEAVINARPLTYVYNDEESPSSPLTQSYLINGRRVAIVSNNQHFEIVSVNKSLTRRAKHHQRLLQQFTSRWKHEYLLSLRERANEKWNGQNKESQISVNLTIRNFWKLAKFEELLPG